MTESTETAGDSLWERCADTTPRDWRNTRRFLWAVAAWGVTFLSVSLAIKKQILPPGPVTWIAAALPIVAGLLACLAYARYLREADELQRQYQLWALGLGFAAGWLALSCYPILERVGAPAMDSSGYTLVMILFFSLGTLLGRIRYR